MRNGIYYDDVVGLKRELGISNSKSGFLAGTASFIVEGAKRLVLLEV